MAVSAVLQGQQEQTHSDPLLGAFYSFASASDEEQSLLHANVALIKTTIYILLNFERP